MRHSCKGKDGHCQHVASHCSQSLDELDFERGIWQAALDGNKKRVEYLISKGFDIDSADSSGYTALHYSSRNGHVDLVEYLLKQGATVNCLTKSGKDSPLHRGAYVGNLAIVRLLIDNGADVMLKNNDGQTCLHKSVIGGHTNVTEYLRQIDPALDKMADNRHKVPFDYM